MTIEEIFEGESKNVEFKEDLPEKSIKYMKSVVAFANGTGGKIVFGIADKTREVVGFDKEDVFKKMDVIFDQALCTGLAITDEDIDILCKAMKEQAVKNAHNEEQNIG